MKRRFVRRKLRVVKSCGRQSGQVSVGGGVWGYAMRTRLRAYRDVWLHYGISLLEARYSGGIDLLHDGDEGELVREIADADRGGIDDDEAFDLGKLMESSGPR